MSDKTIEKGLDFSYYTEYLRYKRKTKEYAYAANYYRKNDQRFFLVPLILLAGTNTVMNGVVDDDTRHLITQISSVLAAITTILIGLQGQLNWGKKSTKYQSVSESYQMLTNKTYGMMMEELMASKKIDKDEKFQKKRQRIFDKFIEETVNSEKGATNGVDRLPKWMTELVLKKDVLLKMDVEEYREQRQRKEDLAEK